MSPAPPVAWTERRVVVTGAAGFIGGRLLRELAARRARPVALDRRPLPVSLPGVTERVADLRAPGGFAGLEAADVVFHLAATGGHAASMEDPLRDFGDNVEATLGLLRSVGPRTEVVFTSTRQLYGPAVILPAPEDHPIRPPDAHSVHKEAAEHLGRVLLGERFRVLRLSNAYGPGQPLRGPGAGFTGGFLRAALAGEAIRVRGNPALRRDPVYVDDIVDALLRAGAPGAPPGTWNVGGSPVSLEAFARRLCEAADRPVRVRTEPLSGMEQAIALGDFRLDASRIRRDLGWRATTPLGEGLRRTVEWFRGPRSGAIHPGTGGADPSNQ